MLHPVSAAATTVHSAARPRGARPQDAAPRTAHRARTSAPQPANLLLIVSSHYLRRRRTCCC